RIVYFRVSARLRLICWVIFFFKQKTAYDISRDWSSDVCSSDLPSTEVPLLIIVGQTPAELFTPPDGADLIVRWDHLSSGERARRSEERRVGKESRAGWLAGDSERKGGGVGGGVGERMRRQCRRT